MIKYRIIYHTKTPIAKLYCRKLPKYISSKSLKRRVHSLADFTSYAVLSTNTLSLNKNAWYEEYGFPNTPSDMPYAVQPPAAFGDWQYCASVYVCPSCTTSRIYSGCLFWAQWRQKYYFLPILKEKFTPRSLYFCVHLWQVDIGVFHSPKLQPLKYPPSWRNSCRKKLKVRLLTPPFWNFFGSHSVFMWRHSVQSTDWCQFFMRQSCYWSQNNGQTPEKLTSIFFYNNKLSNCPLSLVDARHKL